MNNRKWLIHLFSLRHEEKKRFSLMLRFYHNKSEGSGTDVSDGNKNPKIPETLFSPPLSLEKSSPCLRLVCYTFKNAYS